jgi:large subunit ribosomal protein L24
MQIKKDDNVIVVTGKDKGKKGKVVKAFPKENLVIVEGVNISKKHQRPNRSNQKGQIIDKTMPIDASNVMKLDSSGKRMRGDKKKSR